MALKRLRHHQVQGILQGVMHKFEGLGTTHWVSKSSITDETESLKMRIHHFTLKMVGGHVCVFYKRFMRDQDLLPTGGAGWRVFKDGAALDLKHLEVMPTFPISNWKDTEKHIQVSLTELRMPSVSVSKVNLEEASCLVAV